MALAAPPNPNPTRISTPVWRLWTEFDAYYPPALLGGIYAAKPGYHNYRTALPSTDYSVQLLADKRGSGTKADGIDLSMPPDGMKLHTRRLDQAARARDPRLYTPAGPVLREFIGTLDGSTVYCYVLVGGRALGVNGDAGPDPGRDKSHLWHIHLSIIRQFCEDWAALDGVLSVLRGESLAAWRGRTSDMAEFTDKHAAAINYMDGRIEAMAYGRDNIRAGLTGAGQAVWAVQAIKALAVAVSNVDEAVAAQLREDFRRINADVAANATALDEIEADIEATPSQVIAQLTAIPRTEGATALVSAIGPDQARAFAQAVLDITNVDAAQ